MPDIAFWNKCDNRCVMCTNPASFARQGAAQYRLRTQVRKMESYLRGGGVYAKNPDKADFINLTGGEPTLNPDFAQLLAYFRRRLPGVSITLLSNGRRFSDAAFAAGFIELARPPFRVAIPVHAPAAAAHDAIAGVKGAFSQTMAGLRNLFALRGAQDIEIRVVLHKKNAAAFGRLLAFLLKNFPDTSAYGVVVIHHEIEGAALRNQASLGLKLGVSAGLLGASAGLIRRFERLELYHYPLCVLPPGLRPLCRTTLPAEELVYPEEKCGRCARRASCPGLMKDYAARYGCGELRPLRK